MYILDSPKNYHRDPPSVEKKENIKPQARQHLNSNVEHHIHIREHSRENSLEKERNFPEFIATQNDRLNQTNIDQLANLQQQDGLVLQQQADLN